MNRNFRLRRSSDIQRVRRKGKSYAHPLVVLQAVENDQKTVRIGIIASRSIGKAVERNLAKRRLREAIRPFITQLKSGWDLVLIARKPVLEVEFHSLVLALKGLLHKASLFVE